MPVTDPKTLQKELSRFELLSEERNEKFIKALSAALQRRLLHYLSGGDGSLGGLFSDSGLDDGPTPNPDERKNRLEDIREMFSTKKFQVGATGFSVAAEGDITERDPESQEKKIESWVTALQESLLKYYRQAPEAEQLQRLGEISFMFRATLFQVGRNGIIIRSDNVGAETDIATVVTGPYGGGCPPGTVCVDGNCV
ncbi:MAG: hypothetical protein JST85_20530 [Acidobacteria bacterium]|nr:hypothetical protein [Acidobacteriota bacterium]